MRSTSSSLVDSLTEAARKNFDEAPYRLFCFDCEQKGGFNAPPFAMQFPEEFGGWKTLSWARNVLLNRPFVQWHPPTLPPRIVSEVPVSAMGSIPIITFMRVSIGFEGRRNFLVKFSDKQCQDAFVEQRRIILADLEENGPFEFPF